MPRRTPMLTTEAQAADLRKLRFGPRGGILRGAKRPTVAQAEKVLKRWSRNDRTWAILWLILYGVVRDNEARP